MILISQMHIFITIDKYFLKNKRFLNKVMFLIKPLPLPGLGNVCPLPKLGPFHPCKRKLYYKTITKIFEWIENALQFVKSTDFSLQRTWNFKVKEDKEKKTQWVGNV